VINFPMLGSRVQGDYPIIGAFDVGTWMNQGGDTKIRLQGRVMLEDEKWNKQHEQRPMDDFGGGGKMYNVLKLSAVTVVSHNDLPDKMAQVQERLQLTIKRELWFLKRSPFIVGFMTYRTVGSAMMSDLNFELVRHPPEGTDVLEMHRPEIEQMPPEIEIDVPRLE